MKVARHVHNGNCFDNHQFLDLLLPDKFIVESTAYIESLKKNGELLREFQSTLDESLGKQKFKGSHHYLLMIAGRLAAYPHLLLDSEKHLIAAV